MTKKYGLEGFDAFAVLTEARRRAEGEFDGVLGSLPADTAVLLQLILWRTRELLLEEYGSESKVRELIEEFRCPPNEFRGVTPTARGTKYALAILGDIVVAAQVPSESHGRLKEDEVALVNAAGLDMGTLLFGRAGKLSKARLAKAGKQSGKNRRDEAAKWQKPSIDRAKQRISAGTEIPIVVQVLAKAHGKAERQVRNVLQEAGVIAKRPPKKMKKK